MPLRSGRNLLRIVASSGGRWLSLKLLRTSIVPILGRKISWPPWAEIFLEGCGWAGSCSAARRRCAAPAYSPYRTRACCHPARFLHRQLSVLVAWSIVRTVRDWLEPTGFAHIVSVFGLALAIFGALLVPVDLYNVASLSDSMTGILVEQDERQEVVEHGAVIVVLYQVIVAVVAVVTVAMAVAADALGSARWRWQRW